VPTSEQTSSRELLVDLSGAPRGRLGLELQRQLRDAIRSGRLRADASLPSTRALAADLGVSRSVVVLAYEQLDAEGYLITRRGAAARVAAVHLPPAAPAPRPAPTPVRPAAVDFRPGTADLASFPRAEWERAVRRSLMALPDAALGYGDSRGLPRLREALADYLGRVRGAIVAPDHLVVVNGLAQGLAVVARLFRQLGIDAVGVEDPGSFHTATQLDANGLVTVGVPVDHDGIDADRLFRQAGDGARSPAAGGPGGSRARPEPRWSAPTWSRAVAPRSIKGPGDSRARPEPAWWAATHSRAVAPRSTGPLRAVLATPAHQFPTGVILGAARRRRLLAWADLVDGFVVEDDYDAEYRYDHQPVATLQGLAPDRVLLGGSTSKTLAPGLRLGWLAVPPRLAAEAARHKHHIDLMTPVLEQAALAELLTSGAYERHIRRNRARYRRRRDRLLELLADHLPEAKVGGEAAGMHLYVETPSVDEAAAVAEAARRGLLVSGIADYRRSPGPAGFVLAYAHLSGDQLRRGVQTLAAAVHARR
jgi:GntR family transcriptional regulator/MocR family aminotransferase